MYRRDRSVLLSKRAEPSPQIPYPGGDFGTSVGSALIALSYQIGETTWDRDVSPDGEAPLSGELGVAENLGLVAQWSQREFMR